MSPGCLIHDSFSPLINSNVLLSPPFTLYLLPQHSNGTRTFILTSNSTHPKNTILDSSDWREGEWNAVDVVVGQQVREPPSHLESITVTKSADESFTNKMVPPISWHSHEESTTVHFLYTQMISLNLFQDGDYGKSKRVKVQVENTSLSVTQVEGFEWTIQCHPLHPSFYPGMYFQETFSLSPEVSVNPWLMLQYSFLKTLINHIHIYMVVDICRFEFTKIN